MGKRGGGCNTGSCSDQTVPQSECQPNAQWTPVAAQQCWSQQYAPVMRGNCPGGSCDGRFIQMDSPYTGCGGRGRMAEPAASVKDLPAGVYNEESAVSAIEKAKAEGKPIVSIVAGPDGIDKKTAATMDKLKDQVTFVVIDHQKAEWMRHENGKGGLETKHYWATVNLSGAAGDIGKVKPNSVGIYRPEGYSDANPQGSLKPSALATYDQNFDLEKFLAEQKIVSPEKPLKPDIDKVPSPPELPLVPPPIPSLDETSDKPNSKPEPPKIPLATDDPKVPLPEAPHPRAVQPPIRKPEFKEPPGPPKLDAPEPVKPGAKSVQDINLKALKEFPTAAEQVDKSAPPIRVAKTAEDVQKAIDEARKSGKALIVDRPTQRCDDRICYDVQLPAKRAKDIEDKAVVIQIPRDGLKGVDPLKYPEVAAIAGLFPKPSNDVTKIAEKTGLDLKAFNFGPNGDLSLMWTTPPPSEKPPAGRGRGIDLSGPTIPAEKPPVKPQIPTVKPQVPLDKPVKPEVPAKPEVSIKPEPVKPEAVKVDEAKRQAERAKLPIFEADRKKAIEQAQKLNVPLYIFVSSTQCGWCTHMENNYHQSQNFKTGVQGQVQGIKVVSDLAGWGKDLPQSVQDLVRQGGGVPRTYVLDPHTFEVIGSGHGSHDPTHEIRQGFAKLNSGKGPDVTPKPEVAPKPVAPTVQPPMIVYPQQVQPRRRKY